MTFENAVELMYENHTNNMLDEMYKENPDLGELSEINFYEAGQYQLQQAEGE